MNSKDNYLGMIGADLKIFLEPSLGPLTAQSVPSVTYLYSDNTILDEVSFLSA